ncbi:MAG: oligopeptidase B, partial [Acidimicrobiia bacterium]|nr:oligopeptidase B [Acidimicrobiia bacterium]
MDQIPAPTPPVADHDRRLGQAFEPPIAERRPAERERWGEVVADDYGWLRDGDDPAVIAHLEAENAYTESVLGAAGDLQERLYQEIKARIKETDLSVPVRKDDWAYYSRTVEGLAYPVHCRRPAET